VHFWIGTIGILLYILPIYAAGITQGLMWRAFDESGRLMYPDFVETVVELLPLYWIRVLGGGALRRGRRHDRDQRFMTWRMRPPKYEPQTAREAAPLDKRLRDRGPSAA
jgi:cytochrome c oxidase cbb3-type subunit I/II